MIPVDPAIYKAIGPERCQFLIHQVNSAIEELQRKPREQRLGYWLEPGSILNAYREGDLNFDEAKKALESWRERGIDRA